MAVNLDNSVIRQFELAGITKEDIGKTIERDRAAGLSDQDIELNAYAKAESLQKNNPSFTQGRGVSRWISNLPFGDTINRGIQGTKALYDATLDYVSGNNKPTVRQYLEAPEGTTPKDRSWSDLVSENYDENMKKLERTFQEQNYDVPKWYRYPMDAGATIGSYGLLVPEAVYSSVPSAAAFGAADAFQEGIKTDEKNRTRDRMINALIGGVTAGAVTGVVNKITGASAMKKAEKEYPLLAEGFRKNPPKTTEEALDRIASNYIKNDVNNPLLQGRLAAETEKLFNNLPTDVVKEISTGTKGVYDSPLGKALTKHGEEALKLNKISPEKAQNVVNSMSNFVKTGSATKPTTEGLAGGLLGALTGSYLGGPVGMIGGAILGSKGRIGNALTALSEKLMGKSSQGIAKSLVKPQGTNAVSRALRKVVTPAAGEVAKKAAIPIRKAWQNEDIGVLPKKISYEPKPSKKNLVSGNKQSLALPNTAIVLPDNVDSGESITEKHLKLLAALYPQYYQKVA